MQAVPIRILKQLNIHWRDLFKRIKNIKKNFLKFFRKTLRSNLNKVAGLRPATLLKKRLWHSCFPVNFVKFIRVAFL